MKGICALVALALVVLVGCPPTPGRTTALTAALVPGERFVQVVAHPDDDLLFMAPDLYGAVLAGEPTVTVYLTAGEGLAGVDDAHDPHRYVFDRQEGLRAAYAYLAGVPNLWRGATLVEGGVRLRMETLVERPTVRLVFEIG
ncbi:MAG: hypothetical protein HOY71_34545, partial [Nonomuraea sp.]|nr:hypothetical protein [Nonomuraea sp.]